MNLYESVKKSLKESDYDDNVVVMECNRIGYGPDQVMDDSLTVGELIDTLNEYDLNMKIVTSHDNGYTYGPIHYEDFSEEEVDRDEEDEEITESCKDKKLKEADEDVVFSVKEKDIKRLEDEIAKAEARAKEAGSDYVKHPTQKTYGWYDYCKTYAEGLKTALGILKGTPEKVKEPELKETETFVDVPDEDKNFMVDMVWDRISEYADPEEYYLDKLTDEDVAKITEDLMYLWINHRFEQSDIDEIMERYAYEKYGNK